MDLLPDAGEAEDFIGGIKDPKRSADGGEAAGGRGRGF